MATEHSSSWPAIGIDPARFDLNSRSGRFGLRALGLSHANTIHGNAMNEMWQGVGMGRGGLLDFQSYKIGKSNIGALTGGNFAHTVEGQVARHRAMGVTMRNWMAVKGARGGLGRQALGRAIQPAFTAFSTYQGYKEGGVGGAAKGFATAMAFNYLWGAAWKAMGSLGLPVAVVAGAALATYTTFKGGNERIRRTRNIEMGSPIIDPFGNAATMRQRSLQALMNSQINGRSALGTEAQLMHVPVMRG